MLLTAVVGRLGIAPTVPVGGSDHQVFARAHVPAVLVQWDSVRLHTPDDDTATIDLRHLKGAGDVVTIVERELAATP